MRFAPAAAVLALLALASFAAGMPTRPDKEKKLPAQQFAEQVIFAYGGRPALTLVRRTGLEESSILLTTDKSTVEGTLHIRFARKEKSALDRRRIDLELPNQILTLCFDGNQLWSALNGERIIPSQRAGATFRAAGIHNYEALLRYQEDGSQLSSKGSKKVVGIDCEIIELTHQDGSKTLFYVSAKSYRILHLEYEVQLPENQVIAVKQSFYDFRPMQNTLVPAKTVTFENGQIAQTTEVRAMTYGLQVAEEVFQKY